MASTFLFLIVVIILLLGCSHDVQCRQDAWREHRLRAIWKDIKDKIKETTVNRFKIDIRHFDKEEMILFPDVAFQTSDADQPWKVVVHGWRYEGNKRRDWLGFSATHWLSRIASQLFDRNDVAFLNGSIDHDRLRPFFVDDESNEKIEVIFGDQRHLVQTDRFGQFYQEILVSNNDMEQLRQKEQRRDLITYEAIGDNQDKSRGVIHLIDPRQGISVISDIDDTIKISEVLDKVRLLANTFIYPFKPVPGMADLYRQWNDKHPGITFHYLSGMPDQLYILTQEFINSNQFPDGSFHMRHFGWAVSSLFHFLHSESTMNHKLSYLRFFFGGTLRDYVLVGDSGEKDPEIYGTIAREYPDRVRAIFIRAIKGESFDDQRFLSAFQGVSVEKWQVFDDPKQVPLDLSRPPRASTG